MNRLRTSSWTRRAILQLGAIPGIGIALPTLLKARDSSPPDRGDSFGRAKRCILLFLSGGASQHDTWDPKPDAPQEVRGELQSIATTVPGIRVGELFPRVAQAAHHCCFVRSVTHSDTLHSTAGYQMMTGYVHPTSGQGGSSVDRRPLSTDNPHLGSILVKSRPPRGGVPRFTALPEVLTDSGISAYPGQFGGLLGRRYDPFYIRGDFRTGRFQAPDVMLPVDVDVKRLTDRRHLLVELDRRLRNLEQTGTLAAYDDFQQRAFDIARSPEVSTAFDLSQEPVAVRESYGSHLFAQSCLMGRRLLEAGVSLVTVYWPQDGGTKDAPVWDTHEDQAGNLRKRLAPFGDAAIASLLEDLADRGMLQDTLFVCMTEFGRTPKVHSTGSRVGGREHWPFVYSVLLAGAGVHGSRTYGASDAMGAYPESQPVTPADLAASILHLLGVPASLEFTNEQGRPFRACTGELIPALWA